MRTSLLSLVAVALLSVWQPSCASAPPAPTASTAAASAVVPPSKYDARLSMYEYPYEVKTFSFESQRQPLEMAYMDVPPTAEPNGLAVLLLHGKNFSGAQWSTTIEALAGRGFRVIVPDQIGFGKSSKPEHYQFTFQALAANTRQLLDALSVDSVAVVGHSMGGMVATRFALMFPNLTERLVLVNPIGLEDWKLVAPYADVQTWYQNELKKTPDGVRAYMQASYFDGEWKPGYDELAAIQMGWTESPDREQLAWVSALTYDMIFTQPVLYEFGQLTAPTLLIIGQRDRTALGKNLVAPEVAAKMGLYEQLGKRTHEAIPNSQLVELEGIGHIPQVEAWDPYISALTTFLDVSQ